ncbi:MAG: NucA/NucB deoxyribonuclease domain-containing protein [Burkholderiales bacterium]
MARSLGIVALALLSGCGGGNSESITPDTKSALFAADNPTTQPPRPIVLTGPSDIEVVVNQKASFVASSNRQFLSMQWRMSDGRPGSAVLNADCFGVASNGRSQQCTVRAVPLARNGWQYWVVAVDDTGRELISSKASLTVTATPLAPAFTTLPTVASVAAGLSARFEAAATGTSPRTWEWLRDGVPIPGANTPVITIPTLASEAGRAATIQARVKNAFGTALSPAVTLQITGNGTTVPAAEGGSIPLPNGQSLDIPPGALGADTSLPITEEAVPEGLLPADATPLSKVLKLGANGLTLLKPAAISLPLPADLGPDETLAVLELEETTNVKVLAAGDGLKRTLGLSVAGGWQCVNRQNADIDNRISAKVGQGAKPATPKNVKKVVVVRTFTRNCAFVEPRVTAPGVPSITDQACTQDADFLAVNGDLSLVSRHVACMQGQDVGNGFDVRVVDVVDKDGNVTNWKPVNDSTPAASDRNIGNGRIVAKLSIHGASEGLQKKVMLELGIADFIANPNAPVDFAAKSRNLRLKALIQVCADNSGCTVTESGEVMVSLSGGTRRVETTVALPDPGFENQHKVNLHIDKLLYAVVGNEYNTSVRFVDPVLTFLPQLTCDNSLARAKTKGCVFENAAAVFQPTGVPQSAAHIAKSQSELAKLGTYVPQIGTRALGGGRELTRTRDITEIKANRAETTKLCASERKENPPSCTANPDPDTPGVIEANCDCDEYPFASTKQAGASTERPGVQIAFIAAKDNRSAGSQLGNFYRRERIKDATYGSKFWVKP